MVVKNDNIKQIIETANLYNIDKLNINSKSIKTDNLYNIDKLRINDRLGWFKTLVALSYYLIIFAILIPILLLKNKHYNILESYLPNLDLIANLLSFEGGFLPGYFFINLYQTSPTSVQAFFSQTTINYLSLLGVTFIIAREAKISKSITKGWSLGFVMLLMTYLIPSQMISSFMSNLHDFIKKEFNLREPHDKISYVISLIIGIIMTISVIFLEKKIIKLMRSNLDNIGKTIMSIPKIVS